MDLADSTTHFDPISMCGNVDNHLVHGSNEI